MTSKTIRKPWTRDELILLMNLYCRIPFGRQHSRDDEVVEVARILGRTPGSIAMKLNNFTSLDPEEKTRGVKGLSGASRLDQQVWDEFHADWEGMAANSELLWQSRIARLGGNAPAFNESADIETAAMEQMQQFRKENVPTENHRVVHVRLAQSFFRRTVLTAYRGRCCVSDNPVPELLIASHILPWAGFPEQRANPSNGLCLSRLHDAAFDRGLLTFDEEYRLVLSRYLRNHLPNESIRLNFAEFEGKRLQMPEKFLPEQSFMEHHRNSIFLG